MASTDRRPGVALLALGGTIATPAGSERPATHVGLRAEDLVSAVPGIDRVASLTADTFRMTMSASLTLEDVVGLASAIDRARSRGDGVVVTMGTDALEEVAYALDVLLRPGMPVVVTGAMRNAGSIGADGPANLLDAVRVAASADAAGLGVLVVLHGELHAARWARKTHATSLAAFTSPSAGPIGALAEGRVRVLMRPEPARPPLTVERPVPPVALVRSAIGDDGRLLEALPGLGFEGAVLEVFGAGHVPASTMPRIRRLAASLPVVFATRTGAGEPYLATGTFPGSESDLLDAGLVSAGALDGLKARVLLSLVLASGSPWRDAFAERA